MKNFKIFSLITLISITTLSCDPAKILIIKTKKKPNVSVSIYTNKNTGVFNDTTNIKVSSTTNDKVLFFGLGGWGSDSLMPSFSKNIDSIIIVNCVDTLKLNNQQKINDYLLKNRRGFAKRKLVIKAK